MSNNKSTHSDSPVLTSSFALRRQRNRRRTNSSMLARDEHRTRRSMLEQAAAAAAATTTPESQLLPAPMITSSSDATSVRPATASPRPPRDTHFWIDEETLYDETHDANAATSSMGSSRMASPSPALLHSRSASPTDAGDTRLLDILNEALAMEPIRCQVARQQRTRSRCRHRHESSSSSSQPEEAQQ